MRRHYLIERYLPVQTYKPTYNSVHLFTSRSSCRPLRHLIRYIRNWADRLGDIFLAITLTHPNSCPTIILRDFWDTDYSSGNWEPDLITIFVTIKIDIGQHLQFAYFPSILCSPVLQHLANTELQTLPCRSFNFGDAKTSLLSGRSNIGTQSASASNFFFADKAWDVDWSWPWPGKHLHYVICMV